MPFAIKRLLQCRQTLLCNRSHTLFLHAPLLHTGHPHSQRPPASSDTFTERARERERERESESVKVNTQHRGTSLARSVTSRKSNAFKLNNLANKPPVVVVWVVVLVLLVVWVCQKRTCFT